MSTATGEPKARAEALDILNVEMVRMPGIEPGLKPYKGLRSTVIYTRAWA